MEKKQETTSQKLVKVLGKRLTLCRAIAIIRSLIKLIMLTNKKSHMLGKNCCLLIFFSTDNKVLKF